jgi:cytochrome c-type biogenesis protein CcmH
MQPSRSLFFLVPLLLVIVRLVSANVQETPISEIKKSLVCSCDCNMTVEACEGAMACQAAEKVTAEASKYIGQGMNKQAILAAFTTKYGEKVLAAPTKTGFNLTAWVMPFVAIFAGGLFIVLVLGRWAGQSKQQGRRTRPRADAEDHGDAPFERKLDEALRYLD